MARLFNGFWRFWRSAAESGPFPLLFAVAQWVCLLIAASSFAAAAGLFGQGAVGFGLGALVVGFVMIFARDALRDEARRVLTPLSFETRGEGRAPQDEGKGRR